MWKVIKANFRWFWLDVQYRLACRKAKKEWRHRRYGRWYMCIFCGHSVCPDCVDYAPLDWIRCCFCNRCFAKGEMPCTAKKERHGQAWCSEMTAPTLIIVAVAEILTMWNIPYQKRRRKMEHPICKVFFSKISPQDAWTLSVAFGLHSTDESWYDDHWNDSVSNC